MNLPTEIRYKRYEDWTEKELTDIQDKTASSPWRAGYHIEPTSGMLNDPNGFSYFNGKFTLFYQSWPYGPAHGLKSWVHTESEDLVRFTETGTVIYPDTPLDSHGAYSGSAYEIDGKLFIFYTGNVRDENWVRTPLQVGAWMDQTGQIEKIAEVLIAPASDATEHFRDPQIFEYENEFYASVGAQNHDKQGFIKLYKAEDRDVTKWSEVGNLDFGGRGSEYMIECPNLVFVDGQPVLLYSPQGLDKAELDYQNIYPNTYVIGQTFDAEAARLTNPSTIINLDEGFECYATQGFNTPDGRALIVSWIGLPDVDYPTDDYGYQGAMSLVKELSIKDGKLYQYPVPAITSLRRSEQVFSALPLTQNSYELELSCAPGQVSELLLFADREGNGLRLTVDTENGIIELDRSQVGVPFATDFGTTRGCQVAAGAVTLNVFVDKSIVEIFINKGEKVFTSRVFPTAEQTGIALLSGQVTGSYFELAK
ncbi:sucrose-6-phosphate hydrolase [Streptococcus sp. E24BD]|uniref:sucrose-6-phosphate hydrolase n=1 Tax=Streptococcus sp. E24BD TaxID=3278715 RepID=UPI00359D7278